MDSGPDNDRIELIEDTKKARADFGENYGAFEFWLTREQAEGLLAGKVVAFDINGWEYAGFLSMKNKQDGPGIPRRLEMEKK